MKTLVYFLLNLIIFNDILSSTENLRLQNTIEDPEELILDKSSSCLLKKSPSFSFHLNESTLVLETNEQSVNSIILLDSSLKNDNKELLPYDKMLSLTNFNSSLSPIFEDDNKEQKVSNEPSIFTEENLDDIKLLKLLRKQPPPDDLFNRTRDDAMKLLNIFKNYQDAFDDELKNMTELFQKIEKIFAKFYQDLDVKLDLQNFNIKRGEFSTVSKYIRKKRKFVLLDIESTKQALKLLKTDIFGNKISRKEKEKIKVFYSLSKKIKEINNEYEEKMKCFLNIMNLLND